MGERRLAHLTVACEACISTASWPAFRAQTTAITTTCSLLTQKLDLHALAVAPCHQQVHAGRSTGTNCSSVACFDVNHLAVRFALPIRT